MTTQASQSPARDAQPGVSLPVVSIPITSSLIVTGAIATRDFQPLHHDADLARQRGFKDIFMNILTTQGLVCRYATDWAGPNVLVKKNSIKLGAPNYPGDTMTFSGSISARRPVDGACELDIAIEGANSIGMHVAGVVTILVPAHEGAAQ